MNLASRPKSSKGTSSASPKPTWCLRQTMGLVVGQTPAEGRSKSHARGSPLRSGRFTFRGPRRPKNPLPDGRHHPDRGCGIPSGPKTGLAQERRFEHRSAISGIPDEQTIQSPRRTSHEGPSGRRPMAASDKPRRAGVKSQTKGNRNCTIAAAQVRSSSTPVSKCID